MGYEAEHRRYLKNKGSPYQRARKRAGVERLRLRRLEAIAQIKLRHGCMDCPPGVAWPSNVLDFDHVKGEKVKSVSRMWGHSWESILAEIEKCEVVCANHHRVRTGERRGESPWAI